MEDRRPAEASDDEDVVELLVHQHGMIHDLFDEVRAAPADARREPFERLLRMLAVHEVAEEIVVHPLARTAVPGGDEVVADRLAEEHASMRLLSRLEKLDPDDPGFLPPLDELRLAVLAHARAEERYELQKLADELDATARGQLGKAVKAAEAVAPTQALLGVDTPAENLGTGPVMDRVRDAMHRATSDI